MAQFFSAIYVQDIVCGPAFRVQLGAVTRQCSRFDAFDGFSRDEQIWRRGVMYRQSSGVPVYLALALAVLAAISSAPAKGRDTEAKVVWVLMTQAATELAPRDIEELQKLGLP